MTQHVDAAVVRKTNHPVHLFHYTREDGQRGILKDNALLPSLLRNNPDDARYGDGQYLTDITPGSRSGDLLSQALLRTPYHPDRFTHFIQIDTTGLTVIRGRIHVYVVPGTDPLDLSGRIKDWGTN